MSFNPIGIPAHPVLSKRTQSVVRVKIRFGRPGDKANISSASRGIYGFMTRNRSEVFPFFRRIKRIQAGSGINARESCTA